MTDAEKRENVIRGLERFIDDFKPFCGNRNDWQRVYDALALLKEQETMPNEEIKLKSCPFCGGNDLYIVNVKGYLDSTVGVFCNWCKVTVLHEDNEEEGDIPDTRRRAVIAWNRREKDAD